MPTTLEALIVVAYGLAPGYILFAVRNRVVARERPSASGLVVQSVLGSLVIGMFVALIIHGMGWTLEEDLKKLCGMTLLVLVLSAVAGLSLGRFEKSEFFTDTLGLTYGNPTAWDDVFARGQILWVLVTFEDGRRLGGLYARESYASGYPQEQDIYLEKVFDIDEDDVFQGPKDRSMGAWIPKKSIKCLEFWSIEEGTHE